MRPRPAAMAALVASLLTSCSGTSATPRLATTNTPQVTPNTTPRPPRGHQAVLHHILAERDVHHLDVDGDGRPDTVTLTWVHLRSIVVGAGTATATVHFATGGLASMAWHVTDWMDARGKKSFPWLGADNFDGRPGEELVVGWNIGASNTFFEVLTYRDGLLQRLPPPPGTEGWEVGGSAGTGNQAFGCADGTVVAVDSSPRYPNRPLTARGFVTTTTTYRWSPAGWIVLRRQQRLGTESSRLPVRRCRDLGFP
ncbi:MAG: hypothetical protein ACTHK4_09335 [Mycobacteriales bacterium]